MSNYLFAYTGGSMAQTEEEQAASMAAWGAWFAGLADAVIDGGNPFGPSATVGSDGAVRDSGAGKLTGYSVLRADDLTAAGALAKGCPVLTSGGEVEIYEILPVM